LTGKPEIETLPVPLLRGKLVWQVVQLLSFGASVNEGDGPDAEALTFSYLAEKLTKQNIAKTQANAMTDNLTKTIRVETNDILADSLNSEEFCNNYLTLFFGGKFKKHFYSR
jgi:hypothetical protein